MAADSDDTYSIEDEIAPDGGWGWVVLIASFFVMFMIDGLFGSYGLFLPVLMERLDASPSLTSLAGSLIVGSLLFVALLACTLIERFGCRMVAVCGALIAGLGLILSSMAVNIWMFLVTYGLVTGSGIGLIYLPTIVMVNKYFHQKRGIAQSIMSAGSGIGMMVMSPVVELLLDSYNWRGALLVIAGFILQLCVACALYRPLKVITVQNSHNCIDKSKEIENDNTAFVEMYNDHFEFTKGEHNTFTKCIDKKDQSGEKLLEAVRLSSKRHINFLDSEKNIKGSTHSLPRNMFNTNVYENRSTTTYFKSTNCISDAQKSHCSLHHRSSKLLSQKDILYCGSLNRIQRNSDSKLAEGYKTISIEREKFNNSAEGAGNQDICSSNMYSNKSFWCIAIGAFLTQMAQFIPNMFLGDFGIGIGLTSKDVSWILSMFGVVNTIGRLLPGIIVDKTTLSSIVLCSIGMVGCAISCFLFPLCTDFPLLLTYALFFGFFIAWFCPLQPIMILDSVGLDNLTKGLGIVTVLKGPAAILGPPFAGVLYEWTADYNVTILFAGSLCMVTAIVYVIHPIINCLKTTDVNDDSDVPEVISPPTDNTSFI